MTDRFDLVVEGAPVPLERARVGRGRHYLPARSVEFRERIRSAWLRAGRPRLGDVALACSAMFYLARPPSHFGTGRNAGTVKARYLAAIPPGDVDNFAKAIGDALSGCAFADDTQITCLTAVHKLWADADGPRSVVALWAAARLELAA